MNRAVQVLPLGRERTPLLVLDDFNPFTAALLDAALTADFQPDTESLYPGVRAPIPGELALAILRRVYRQLYPIYNLSGKLRLKPLRANFSLVSCAPQQLGDLQRIPHFDATNPHYFALLLYLNPGEHGSTGFFRHLPTGYERIDEERSERYFTSASRYIEQCGAPNPGYLTDSCGQYQLYHQVEYRQHRLVVYPGNLLHSILVQKPVDIDPNPRTGRLTANLFFDFR